MDFKRLICGFEKNIAGDIQEMPGYKLETFAYNKRFNLSEF